MPDYKAKYCAALKAQHYWRTKSLIHVHSSFKRVMLQVLVNAHHSNLFLYILDKFAFLIGSARPGFTHMGQALEQFQVCALRRHCDKSVECTSNWCGGVKLGFMVASFHSFSTSCYTTVPEACCQLVHKVS